MAGNVKISALPDVEQSQVQDTAYFPFSDKFGVSQSYESKKMSLEQIATYVGPVAYTPTLAATPTSSTTTYIKDGQTISFKIGQFARVADDTSETGYRFYQLADLNNGVAVWQEVFETPFERVIINLSANANIDALKSAAPTVTVTSTKKGQIFSERWNGDSLKLQVEPGDTYTVSVEEVEGFATPLSQTYTAEFEGVNNITFNYTTVGWSVAVTSNQNNDTVIAALTGTASWTYNGHSYSKSGLANRDVVYIPTGVTPTFSIADATGYKKTVTVASASITAAYETEVVTVTVDTDQSGVTAEGQVITINGSNYTVDSTGIITVKVPYGTSYTVSADAMSGYDTPATQSFTASHVSRAVTMTYTKVWLGVFILDTTGGLTTADAWSSTGKTLSDVVGIAVLTADHKFVMAPEDFHSKEIYRPVRTCDGATAITDQTLAKQDFDGAGNTALMVASYGSDDTYAAGTATTYSRGGKSWYLPSLGELWTAYNNKAAVDAALSACGATAMNIDYYWTSTYYGVWWQGETNFHCSFWLLGWSDGLVLRYDTNNSRMVRPFCAF